jgi:hypothetical protein
VGQAEEGFNGGFLRSDELFSGQHIESPVVLNGSGGQLKNVNAVLNAALQQNQV